MSLYVLPYGLSIRSSFAMLGDPISRLPQHCGGFYYGIFPVKGDEKLALRQPRGELSRSVPEQDAHELIRRDIHPLSYFLILPRSYGSPDESFPSESRGKSSERLTTASGMS